MRFKEGVNLQGIKSPMLRAMAEVEEAYLQVTNIEPTVTSALDSHQTGLHPRGLAIDIRVKDIPRDTWEEVRAQIDTRLNPRYNKFKFYDVILELHRPGHEHIHIEYDPEIRKAI